jgi:plastocyanin
MNRLAGLLVAAFVLWTASAWAAATIEGVVQLPPAAVIPPVPARYQNKINGEVGAPESPRAVVYLEGDFPASARTNLASARMEQEKYQFAPGLLAVRTGTTIEFPNLDEGYHNVFSYSKPKRFDLGRYRKDERPPTLVFEKPGVVRLYCEIHSHMRGTILVLDTPFFAKTDASGKFRLEQLPVGKFVLKAWINEQTVWTQPVELGEGAVLHVKFPVK